MSRQNNDKQGRYFAGKCQFLKTAVITQTQHKTHLKRFILQGKVRHHSWITTAAPWSTKWATNTSSRIAKRISLSFIRRSRRSCRRSSMLSDTVIQQTNLKFLVYFRQVVVSATSVLEGIIVARSRTLTPATVVAGMSRFPSGAEGNTTTSICGR